MEENNTNENQEKKQTSIFDKDQEQLNRLEKVISEIKKLYEQVKKQVEEFNQDIQKNNEETQEVVKKADTLLKENLSKTTEKTEELIKKISGTELNINQADKQILSNTEGLLKKLKKFFYIFIGMIAFSLITVIITLYMANQYYRDTLMTSTQVKEQLIKQLKAKKLGIYSTEYINALEGEKEIIKYWKRANRNDSKSYIQFREAIIEDWKLKELPYFEKLDDDVTAGGKSGKKIKIIFKEKE